MNPKANAVLLQAKTKALEVKASRNRSELWTPVHKAEEQRVVVALPDAGRDDWARVKRECVLLKRKG